MKYLKTFEKLLKKTDTKVLNNPLLNISEKLEELLLKIKELDEIEHSNVKREKSKVRRYFNSYGDILINYFDNTWLFKFKIFQYDDDVRLITSYEPRTNNIDKNSIDLYKFLKIELKEYITSDFYKTLESYRFPMSEIDIIIEKFKKYKDFLEIKINATKYNL